MPSSLRRCLYAFLAVAAACRAPSSITGTPPGNDAGGTSLSADGGTRALPDGGGVSDAGGTPDAGPPHLVHGCSPLATGQCLTPFPNSWFEQAASNETGLEVIFPDGTLPSNAQGTAVSQSTVGTLDGFSPATTLIAYFPQGVDPGGLTSPDSMEASLSADNPIALVDLTTGERVAFFSELDANADPDGGDRQALLIHPAARLAHARRYAVAITTSLHDATGSPLQPEGEFAQWVEGALPPSAPLAELAGRLDADARAFAALGIQKEQLALAWDFDTGSETQATGHLVQMRDAVLAAAPEGMGYEIDTVTEDDGGTDGDGGLGALRVVDGHFWAPSFEQGLDPSRLNLDAQGNPVMGLPMLWPFTAVIPHCAEQRGPVPLLIIGHGLFDTAESELMDDRALLESLCMVGIGTDWLGVTTVDQIALGQALLDGNQFPMITDRLQQAHANFQVLTRLATHALASDPVFAVASGPSYDPTTYYYWGASNGGIQGATYLALSPDVMRGVLNVPGSEWSLMIWRSSHFAQGIMLFGLSYPDKVDQQVLVALTQSLWDRTDPIEFAPHLTDPLPGVPVKQALFQEATGDTQVPNLSTEVEMRTLGVTALSPMVNPVFGVASAAGPLNGLVYTQWDVQPSPMPPLTNVPPTDNAAHEACRRLPETIAQTLEFLSPGGTVIQTCDGGCVFPPGTGS